MPFGSGEAREKGHSEGAEAQEKQRQEREHRGQLTWDVAATSQSPALPIFGRVGPRGVRTAEEKNTSLKPEIW